MQLQIKAQRKQLHKRIFKFFFVIQRFMRKKIIFIIIIVVGLVCYLLLGDYFHFYLFCPIKKITGLYCPGCGVTRMLLSILKGEFYQAFRYNPLIFICLPLFLLYYLDYTYSTIKKKKPRIHTLEPGIWYFLITVFIIYGVLRNIPLFDILKPTIIK